MPDGRTGVNQFSIGIELMNTPEDFLTDAQYDSLRQLMHSIRSRYTIKSVVGHQTIAPLRKTDPWNLDWERIEDW
jgi:N-acetyl-anhydromuramyl-L-alanine amidase AmpD